MIFPEQNLLFIHVPKTGGNSVQYALAKFSPDRLVKTGPGHDLKDRFEVGSNEKSFIHKHSSYLEYERAYGAAHLAKYTVVYTLRNPWERAVSYYFSPHRQVHSWNRAAFVACLEEIKPASFYIKGAAKIHVLRFERLNKDFSGLAENFFSVKAELPHLNKSLNRRSWQSFYDDELRYLIEEKFSDDIKMGSYTRPV